MVSPRRKKEFRVLSNEDVASLQDNGNPRLRREIESIDSRFNDSLGDTTKQLNIDALTGYVLETGVMPDVAAADAVSAYQKSLEDSFNESRELEDGIRRLILHSGHKDYYAILEKVTTTLCRALPGGKKFIERTNRRVEEREYSKAWNWLDVHVSVYENEHKRAEEQYQFHTKRIEELRTEILQGGFTLEVRKKALDGLQEKLGEARKAQAASGAMQGDSQKEKFVTTWNQMAFDYQRDLPKFQKDIMRLESEIETKWLQIAQTRAARLIAYKNLMLFSKAAIVFEEVRKRLDATYEMAGVGNVEAPLTSVAKGVKFFDPVQRKMDSLSEKYSDLAESMPSAVYDLITLSPSLEKKATNLFGSLWGTNEHDYKRAVDIVSKVKMSTV